MSKPIIALQLYTVRDFANQDLPGTLSQVKAMGYDAVELAGTYGMDTEAFKKLLDDTGLETVSAHVGIAAFREDLAGTVSQYKALGCRVIGIPSLKLEDLPGAEGFEATKELLIKIAAQCNEHGLALMYHNHAYEFGVLKCGRFVLDALFDAMPPGVLQAQIDVGWVLVAGQDPVQYVKKYKGRCPSVHLKDIVKVGNIFEDRPVGKGLQDIPAITKAAEETGAGILVVELDKAVGITSLEAASESREYLKTLGY